MCVSGSRNNNSNNNTGANRPTLCIGSNVIVSVNEMKDLVVIVDNHLRAFKTYVRPILEYASCIRSPHLQGSIKHIESVQRKFTKRLYGLANIS